MQKLDIINMAISRLGKTVLLTSLEEDGVTAQTANLSFDHARDSILSAGDWEFASRRVALSLQGTPGDEWSYSYAYPSDCLRTIKIVDGLQSPRPDQRIPFKVVRDKTSGERRIWTDQASAELDYVYRLTDVSVWPVYVQEALVTRMTAELAMPLTGDPRLAIDWRTLAMRDLFSALAEDLNQGQPPEEPESSIIASRS